MDDYIDSGWKGFLYCRKICQSNNRKGCKDCTVSCLCNICCSQLYRISVEDQINKLQESQEVKSSLSNFVSVLLNNCNSYNCRDCSYMYFKLNSFCSMDLELVREIFYKKYSLQSRRLFRNDCDAKY